MREFIVYSEKGATSSNFSIKDLPGSGGRMDLIARCVISALWLSKDIRRNSRIIFSLNGPPQEPVALEFDGSALERVTPDERNIAIWIKKSFGRKEIEKKWKEVHKGIRISKRKFEDIIKDKKDKKLYILNEDGDDIRNVEIDGDPVFILGDHIGLPNKKLKFVQDHNGEKISLGPKSYFTTHSITLTHNELDRQTTAQVNK